MSYLMFPYWAQVAFWSFGTSCCSCCHAPAAAETPVALRGHCDASVTLLYRPCCCLEPPMSLP